MRNSIIAVVYLCVTFVASAQEKPFKEDHFERIKTQKIAFITEKIGLNPSSAQKFWPLYNEFSAKKDSLITRRSIGRRELHENKDKLTGSQKEAALDLQIKLRWEEAELDKHYHEKFKKVLTIDQLILLYDAEHEFRMRLIKQIRNMKVNSQTEEDLKNISLAK